MWGCLYIVPARGWADPSLERDRLSTGLLEPHRASQGPVLGGVGLFLAVFRASRGSLEGLSQRGVSGAGNGEIQPPVTC